MFTDSSLVLWLPCVAELLGRNSEPSILIGHKWKLLQAFRLQSCACCFPLEVEKLGRYLISLIEQKPWPSREFSLWIPTWCYSSNNHFPRPAENVMCMDGFAKSLELLFTQADMHCNCEQVFHQTRDPSEAAPDWVNSVAVRSFGVATVNEFIHVPADKLY